MTYTHKKKFKLKFQGKRKTDSGKIDRTGKTNKLIAVVGKLYNNYLEKIIDMILINCSYGLRNRWNKLYEPELSFQGSSHFSN